MELAPGNGLSLQMQIRRALLGAIRARRLPIGARIASTRLLAQDLGVARNTVALALKPLVDEHVLEVRDRSGFYVAARAAAALRREPPSRPAASQIDWAGRLQIAPSLQRNICKPAEWHQHRFPFVFGQSDPTLFPTADWRDCARATLSALDIRGWARDLIDGDYEPLMDELRVNILPRRGVWPAPDEVLLTLGAQHALFLAASLLAGPATRVGFEEPGYPDARNMFLTRRAEIVPIPVDRDGLDLSQLNEDCGLFYVSPSSHCPTGVSMTPQRRRALLQHCRANDAIIIEDDYGADLFGDDRLAKSLKSEDSDGRVIYIGSLSKILAPGLRLGYIVAPAPLIAELRAMRRLMLRHPPTNNQYIVSLFISLGYMESHFLRYKETLSRRADALLSALEEHLPDWQVTFVRPGSSVWLKAPEHIDVRALAVRALRAGVVIEPGDIFFAGPDGPRNFIRLGFASLPVERIASGIKALASVSALACGPRSLAKAGRLSGAMGDRHCHNWTPDQEPGR